MSFAPWTKLSHTDLYIISMEYNKNETEYHNWEHIKDCYQWLEDNSIPHDAQLDYAVAFHDIIYDKDPDKEFRSATHLENVADQIDVKEAKKIIMGTISHSVTPDSTPNEIAMIKADLHQLTIPEKTIENYSKIMKESKKLYGVDGVAFADGNIAFMNGLLARMSTNHRLTGDEFWNDVTRGLELTRDISIGVKDFYR